MRCLPGSRVRNSVAHVKSSVRSLVAATVLSVPHLILPAAPADAACETSGRIDHRGATDLLTAGVFASQVTSGGLRIDPWRSRDAGKLAGSADLQGGRWGKWSSVHFAQLADDGGSDWTGSREMTGRGLVLVRSFPSLAGDPAAPGGRWLALDWGPAAPVRFAVEPGRRGNPLVDPLGADCERSLVPAPRRPSYGASDGGLSAGYRSYEAGDSPSGTHPSAGVALAERFPVRGGLGYPGRELTPAGRNRDESGGPPRPWRTADGVSPSRPDPNGRAGARVEPGAGLGVGTQRSRDLDEASLAHRRAYPGNRIDWNGGGHVALSGLCFESERRGRC